MTVQEIREIITSHLNDVMLDYRGDVIFVNPWNDQKYEFGYKDVDKTYTGIDELMSDKIYDGKSLSEIASEVTQL